MTPWPPRKVRVVGNSGAGKTTFARALAARLGVAHRELDEVFWGPGWTRTDEDVARGRLQDFLTSSTGGWVVDGNWNSARRGLADDADVVVWLDYPRRVVMSRVVRRTLARALLGRTTYHGNRESVRALLRTDPEENIVLWAWTQHHAYRDRYLSLSASGTVPVVRLATPRAARRWLAASAMPATHPHPPVRSSHRGEVVTDE